MRPEIGVCLCAIRTCIWYALTVSSLVQCDVMEVIYTCKTPFCSHQQDVQEQVSLHAALACAPCLSSMSSRLFMERGGPRSDRYPP
jgi:hypothetical protein